jgi:hypothetical protein
MLTIALNENIDLKKSRVSSRKILISQTEINDP